MTLPGQFQHLTIRPLQPGDEEGLSAFYQSLSERTRYFYQPYSKTDVEVMKEVVQRAIGGEDLSYVGVDGKGEVIAHISTSPRVALNDYKASGSVCLKVN